MRVCVPVYVCVRFVYHSEAQALFFVYVLEEKESRRNKAVRQKCVHCRNSALESGAVLRSLHIELLELGGLDFDCSAAPGFAGVL